jgi:hypothetical protein
MRNSNLQLLVFLILAFFQLAFGQDLRQIKAPKTEATSDVRYDNLVKNLNDLNQAFLANDFNGLVSFMFLPNSFLKTHGKLTKKRKAIMAAAAKKEIDTTKANGFTPGVKLEKPGKIIAGDRKLFSLIKKTTIVTVAKGAKDLNGEPLPPGRHELNGFNIAVSSDNGKTWFFGEKVTRELFKAEFPEAAKLVVLPIEQPIVFIPESVS